MAYIEGHNLIASVEHNANIFCIYKCVHNEHAAYPWYWLVLLSLHDSAGWAGARVEATNGWVLPLLLAPVFGCTAVVSDATELCMEDRLAWAFCQAKFWLQDNKKV